MTSSIALDVVELLYVSRSKKSNGNNKINGEHDMSAELMSLEHLLKKPY
jgi:hypothetical protein